MLRKEIPQLAKPRYLSRVPRSCHVGKLAELAGVTRICPANPSGYVEHLTLAEEEGHLKRDSRNKSECCRGGGMKPGPGMDQDYVSSGVS